MTRTPDQAIDHCSRQSKGGPAFAVGTCKKQCRLAYAVPSDGTGSAAEAWRQTDYRLNVAGDQAPRGALLWWTGGSNDYGHVAIADGKGGVWSTDILRNGYFDHVPFAKIGSKWPSLRFVGVSRDIDGVLVVPVAPMPPAPEKPAVAEPTLADCAIALDRIGATMANPAAKRDVEHAEQLLREVADSGRVRVPTTLAGVRQALRDKADDDLAATKSRHVKASLDLLHEL